ncbi:polysaccharide biosynthesis tyrosine autokinase [Agrococcus sp. BE272]|uniref:polysaccharide biosynthesis tyrosine autokinase n=1 Tax=Agrococcus sp. BE272 TaxID=2817727 RepID=UPI00285E7C06|nr:polysaccharide biosynthesis tyrosine autokinase [Agrococcus sp. BE272]MDR7234334.1 capsular exopolysaccharide synthesis family protein [Agrococcus sp. BE272]
MTASEPAQWTLGHVWEALRKFWALVAGLTVLGGAAGYLVSSSVEPEFQARASLYFALNQGTSGADLNQGSAYTQNQMLSFARLATSSRVLEPVIERLALGTTPRDLARSIAITIPQDTVILDVTATSTDPDRAAEIANTVSDELAAVVQEVAAESTDGAATISASVIDDAVPPEVQSVPNKPRDALLAAAVGFLVGALAAFVATMADTRVRNEAAVARVTNLPVLGAVTRTKRAGAAGLIVAREPHSPVAEDMRRIQSALAFSALDGQSRRLLITSASPSEGKSTFSANLSLTLAAAGERTLIIDGDLRRPRVAELFGIDGEVGLTTALFGKVKLAEAVVPWRDDGPDVLTTGALPPNPAAVLTSLALRSLLDSAAHRYDVVLIDSPPVLTVADSNLLAPLVDGVVIVVDASRTRRPQLANTIRSIESAGGRILGIVLNKARTTSHRAAYYVQTPRRTAWGRRRLVRAGGSPAAEA